jgi:hypothetical protein
MLDTPSSSSTFFAKILRIVAIVCFIAYGTLFMLTPTDDNDHQHRLRELEKAIESLTIMRDVVRQCCAEPYNLRRPRGNPNIVLVRIEEKLMQKMEEWERLMEIP